jgi:phytol kinase
MLFAIVLLDKKQPMERILALIRSSENSKTTALWLRLEGEIVRKSLHLLIALVPLLAAVDQQATMMILGGGTLFYVLAENLRLAGRTVFIVSDLTVIASRPREAGRFVLGPVTLGTGAMLALLLYPSQAATIAIYALAFGDGLASLVGRLFGGWRLPLGGRKTVAGSLACFLAVLLVSQRLLGDLRLALPIALAATLIEALPAGDFDNLLLPVGTGYIASKLLILT